IRLVVVADVRRTGRDTAADRGAAQSDAARHPGGTCRSRRARPPRPDPGRDRLAGEIAAVREGRNRALGRAGAAGRRRRNRMNAWLEPLCYKSGFDESWHPGHTGGRVVKFFQAVVSLGMLAILDVCAPPLRAEPLIPDVPRPYTADLLAR